VLSPKTTPSINSSHADEVADYFLGLAEQPIGRPLMCTSHPTPAASMSDTGRAAKRSPALY
jgi:hypothetical protein